MNIKCLYGQIRAHMENRCKLNIRIEQMCVSDDHQLIERQ